MCKMKNNFSFKRSVILLISILFIFISCKKDSKNLITVSGKIIDPNTNVSIEGARVVLSGNKLSSGGIYSSGYTEIASMMTDASGAFSCNFKEDKYSGYRITVSKDRYFGYTVDLTTDDLLPGNTFSPVYSIYPECFIRVEVQNVMPQNSNDHISYSFTSGAVSCYECCDNSMYNGYGMDYTQTFICKTHGNQNVVLSYNVTKGVTTMLYTINHYCPAYDTTAFIVNY